jgi:hypothetical protein
MALKGHAGADLPLGRVDSARMAVRSRVGTVRVVRVVDPRLGAVGRTAEYVRRMCRGGTDADSSDGGDRRRDHCTTSKFLHVETFSVLFPGA